MTVFLRNKKVILSGLFPSLVADEIDLEKFKEAEGFYITDPWERVKSIFTLDEFGNWHPELIYVYHMTYLAGVAGGIFGGMLQALKDSNKFLSTNDTQIYANMKEAQRAFSNSTISAMVKGACKWAPSFALFSGGFILLSSCCELYYNKHRIINNTIAGASVGALFKVSFGIKGIIIGGAVGGILGTLYGIAFWGIYKITNTDHIQFKYANFAYAKYKQQSKLYKKPSNNVFDDISILADSDSSDISEVENNSVQKNEKTDKIVHDK